ncbi:hypothetical protein M422DRAFT_46422 [Sphaerobolus stellatus SS14]|uniref:Uncharacterized protein n=1 Tax=Sphaerobolus stellatus (strain SS14) TaxID=990650 RepID=A0A0C9USL5_SPHS4|nr:hypothetical protein M422DRAFT_46422 [Sphaerobolus stellatus SS14]
MHRIFQVHDIVHLIVKQLVPPTTCTSIYAGAGDLARVARVQKAIGDVALDVLWESVGFEAIPHLFGSDVVDVDDVGKMQFFVNWPTPKCLDRFRLYAPRIRTVQRPYTEKYIDILNVLQFLSALSRLSPTPLFPSLRSIRWFSAEISELPFLHTLFNPDLTSFLLTLAHIPSRSLQVGDAVSHSFPASFLESPLKALVERNVCLKELWVPSPGLEVGAGSEITTISLSFEAPCLSLIDHSPYLTHISIIPTPSILVALSHLSSLKWLILNVRPILPTSPSHDSETPQPLPTHRFPSLETITAHTPTLASLNSILNIVQKPDGLLITPKYRISVDAHDAPTPAEITSFIDLILPPSGSPTLESFRIFSSSRTRITINPNEPNSSITLLTLTPVLLCPQLVHFEINAGFPLSLTDSNLVTLARSWPNMSNLVLGSETESMGLGFLESERGITLEGLETLAQMERLRYLTVIVRVSDISTPVTTPQFEHGEMDFSSAQVEEKSKCSLRVLSVGSTRMHTSWVSNVTKFLGRCFPNLEFVSSVRCVSGEEGREAWRAVERGLRAEREAKREQQVNH